jgi:hypothetical protein
VYEIYPGAVRNLQDFEGRRLDVSTTGGRTSLTLSGAPARVTIVWRFQQPAGATLDGVPLALRSEGNSASATFAHSTDSRLVWW